MTKIPFKNLPRLFPPALFKYINWVKPIRMELDKKVVMHNKQTQILNS